MFIDNKEINIAAVLDAAHDPRHHPESIERRVHEKVREVALELDAAGYMDKAIGHRTMAQWLVEKIVMEQLYEEREERRRAARTRARKAESGGRSAP